MNELQHGSDGKLPLRVPQGGGEGIADKVLVEPSRAGGDA